MTLDCASHQCSLRMVSLFLHQSVIIQLLSTMGHDRIHCFDGGITINHQHSSSLMTPSAGGLAASGDKKSGFNTCSNQLWPYETQLEISYSTFYISS